MGHDHSAVLPLPVPVDGDGPLRGLVRALRPSSRRLALAVVAYLVKDSPVWVLPVITSAVIDTVVAGGPSSRLVVLGVAAVALVAVNYPVTQVYVRCYMATVRDLGVGLRNRLAHRLQELSIGFHSRSSAAVVQTKVVRDVENVELMLQQGANPLLSAIGAITGALVVIAVQVPLFLLLFVLVVPAAVVPVRLARARSEERNERFRRDVEELSSHVGEMASLLPITRAHGLEAVATDRVATSARSVRDSGLTLDRLNGQFTAAAWVLFQLLSIACLVGAALISVGGLLPITAGQVVLLSTYFVMVTNAVVNLLNLAPLATRGRESLRSMSELLTEPDVERNQGKHRPATVVGRLTFEGVDYRYDTAGALAVQGLHLDVQPGETIAFVGPSGSGKSTVLNLALGFLRPTGGRLLLDGVDVDTLDLRAVRSHVSVVPQESVLFAGSIRDNVTYGMPDATDDEHVRAALHGANALEMVLALPNGLDTVLGERGARLSGGQRQRISIARALIRDPRILLLDEATSALDGQSERLVHAALATLRRGRTTLVVAHRLSTIRSADRIVVLEGGRVVEVGNHDALLAHGGAYTRMRALQAT